MKATLSPEVMLVGEYHKLLGGSYMSYLDGMATYLKPGGGISRIPFNPSDLPGAYRFFFLAGGDRMEEESQTSFIKEQLEHAAFASTVRNEYLPIKQKLIEALLGIIDVDPALLFRIVSDFQYTHFRKLIPEPALDVWIEGQISNEYYLKLNGSSGSDLLGIAHENLQETLNERWKQKIIWIE